MLPKPLDAGLDIVRITPPEHQYLPLFVDQSCQAIGHTGSHAVPIGSDICMPLAAGDISVDANDGNPVFYGRINCGNHIIISPADNHQAGALALHRIADRLDIGSRIGTIRFCNRYFNFIMFRQAQEYGMGATAIQ